jgi:lipopolysaccharide biosynthesis regulator YciM
MAGDLRTATTLAEEILDADHTDPHALQALMILHEKTERWRDALKMGEALLRLKPDDKALQKRVKKIADNARREPGTVAQRIPSGRWSFRRDR